MALQSSIEWTEATWNPVTGCSKISPGCKHCYAERMAFRLLATGHPHYRDGFKATLHADSIDLPLRWRRPRSVFVEGDLEAVAVGGVASGLQAAGHALGVAVAAADADLGTAGNQVPSSFGPLD